MYTRTPGNARIPTPIKQRETPAAVLHDGMEPIGAMPVLIPKDYHGEFLRDHRTPAGYSGEDAAALEPDAASDAPVMERMADAVRETAYPASAAPVTDSKKSLIGGLYDLLLGENSSEEETLLLLGIALLLLWGHLDRGDLFDRSTWESDDLALILIGYLLLS